MRGIEGKVYNSSRFDSVLKRFAKKKAVAARLIFKDVVNKTTLYEANPLKLICKGTSTKLVGDFV